MKLTVGMGSIDEYIPYVEAGADEVFCGYVPLDWSLQYNIISPLNRREVVYYNVQLGSKSELDILKDMKMDYGIPVVLTFNALFYLPDQYPLIENIIRDCLAMGYDSFIVADPALLLYLKQTHLQGIRLMISGEIGEQNSCMLNFMKEVGATRIIFHRKMTLTQMETIIRKNKSCGIEMEYEAFLLNEMCHYHGGFCNSFHCDELCHMCLAPYRLMDIKNDVFVEERRGEMASYRDDSCGNVCKTDSCGDTCRTDSCRDDDCKDENAENEQALTGQTGCGLCKLWRFREIGITHLKLVSRGNYIDQTLDDIKQVRQALGILRDSPDQEAYIKRMKQALFPEGSCSGHCYYRGKENE